MFSAYGKISEVKPSPKGYTRLTVSYNIPFNTNHLKFNVWDLEHLLSVDMKPLKKKDSVFIEYSYKNGYPQLHKIEEKLVDNCPVCYSSLEALDAQRMECDGCRNMPLCDHSKRIHEEMKLVSSELNSYSLSKGLKLEFYHGKDSRIYNFVIFENDVLFDDARAMQIGFDYTVTAWSAPNKKFLKVVDITSKK